MAVNNINITTLCSARNNEGVAWSKHDNRGLKMVFGLLAEWETFLPFTTFHDVSYLNRSSFLQGFIFGSASSAYQYEGAARAGGKGPSIWDTFTHKYPEKKIKDVSNGDVLDDSYHRYKEDIGIMKYMNLDAYRFSISWSRVLPKGKLSAGVNHEGVNYYNNLINELMANGLQPYVSLFHWDVPQALEDEYGGFLSPHIVVKHWITLNEPRSVSKNGYANGRFAPGRCSDWLKLNCTGSDSRIEPYLTLHYQLLAHAATAKLYKTKYQPSQKGLIGITLNFGWYVLVSKEKSDRDAARIWTHSQKVSIQKPCDLCWETGYEFSKEEARQLKGSFDFLGLNYYSSFYAAYAPHQPYMKTYCNACDRLARLLWVAESTRKFQFFLCVRGDHSTPVEYRDHSFEMVPFAICWLKDFVGAIGESTISKSSIDPFPIASVKSGEDLLDDLETEDRRDKCCEAYSGDSVYELNEVAAAKGCLGHFPRGEMMGIIKKFINLDAGTD
ncbi:Cyanogenic beta-glucosidase [Glycine max]|nr:Cyanogenic beta-glucosidase [Glycine max]